MFVRSRRPGRGSRSLDRAPSDPTHLRLRHPPLSPFVFSLRPEIPFKRICIKAAPSRYFLLKSNAKVARPLVHTLNNSVEYGTAEAVTARQSYLIQRAPYTHKVSRRHMVGSHMRFSQLTKFYCRNNMTYTNSTNILTHPHTHAGSLYRSVVYLSHIIGNALMLGTCSRTCSQDGSCGQRPCM